MIIKDDCLKFIKENKNKLTNKEIAKELGISHSYVTKLKRENGMPSKIQYDINFIHEQILLSGILGDGNFKKNGKYNYYYRECHSVLEQEYLQWKFDNLKPLTDGCAITFKPKKWETQNDQKNFNTKTLKELIPYANTSKGDAIKRLNDLGLVLYILDDGWKHHYSRNNNNFNINLAVHGLTEEEKQLLLNRYKNILNVDGKIICADRNTISFSRESNDIFIKILKKYNLYDLDISIKKFH